MIPTTEDYLEIGLGFRLSQFVDAKNLEGFLRAFLPRLQALDVETDKVLKGRLLGESQILLDESGAETIVILDGQGAQLDVLGQLVGQPRLGLDDDLYRLFLRARIRVNRTRGTCADVVGLYKLLSESGATFVYEEPGFHGFQVEQTTPLTLDLKTLADLVAKARGVGIWGQFSYSLQATNSTKFTFDDWTLPMTEGDGMGFDDDNYLTVGGLLNGVILT